MCDMLELMDNAVQHPLGVTMKDESMDRFSFLYISWCKRKTFCGMVKHLRVALNERSVLVFLKTLAS